jgi:hypothetical protein
VIYLFGKYIRIFDDISNSFYFNPSSFYRAFLDSKCQYDKKLINSNHIIEKKIISVENHEYMKYIATTFKYLLDQSIKSKYVSYNSIFNRLKSYTKKRQF